MTDYHGIVRLVLKLFGMGLVIFGVISFGRYLPAIIEGFGSMPPGMLVAYSVQPLMPLMFGILLWLFPSPVANTIVAPAAPRKRPSAQWDLKLERIGVSLLGVFLFYRATSDLVYHLANWQANRRYNVGLPEDFAPLMAATIAELAIAAFLVLGSAGLVNTLKRLRTAGKG